MWYSSLIENGDDPRSVKRWLAEKIDESLESRYLTETMKYRLRKYTEQIKNQRIEIECLENLNQTIDDLFAELEKTGDSRLLEELCPYFGTVWPSARALAEKMVEQGSALSGARVLELGCGLALPSLLCARLGAQVVATDFHPEVPRFLERNLKHNGLGASQLQYIPVDWRAGFPDLGHFDWVIGSDVLYERAHAELLAQVVGRYVSPRGQSWIADPARPYLQSFVDAMTKLGFCSETSIRQVQDEPVPKEIFLVELRRI